MMKNKSFKMLVASLVIGMGTLVLPRFSIAASPAPISVHFIDVGQGDAIYIKAPNGEDILIDAGNKTKGDVVISYLKKLKVDDIEVMIATHPDADHIGGLDEVLAAYKVESVYAPKASHTTQAYKDFLLAVKREGLTIKTAKAGVKLPIQKAEAKFIAPVKDYSNSDLNNWSAVLYMKYNKNTFLFTGDAETASENDMITSKTLPQADVLKVGHHGAKTSSSLNFLKVVKPKYAVISVGKNAYGHPTADVLNRFKLTKTAVLRTDQSGSIVIQGNGTSYTIKKSR